MRCVFCGHQLSPPTGDALDRDAALTLVQPEHGDALGGAALDGNIAHRHADGLPAIGDQHKIVGILHREGGNHRGIFLTHADSDDAGTAAPGNAIFVGTAALAITVGGQSQHKLLARAQLRIAFGRESGFLDALFGIRCFFHHALLLARGAARRIGLFEIGARFRAGGVGMIEQ